MTLCDAISLFLGLYAGFYSVVLASHDWFSARYPVYEEKLAAMVAAIKRHREAHSHQNGNGGSDCNELAMAVRQSMAGHRFYLFLPTAIFLVSMLICTVLAIVYFDDEPEKPHAWMKVWFITCVIIFCAAMLGCMLMALLKRQAAFQKWENLQRDLNWVPEDPPDDYTQVRPVSPPPDPLPAEPKGPKTRGGGASKQRGGPKQRPDR